MKKHIAIIFILLATIVCTISYASENSILEENIKKLNKAQSNASENVDTQKTYTLCDVDTRPRIIKRVRPIYPPEAKKKGIEGEVILDITVTKNGFVKNPEVCKSVPVGVFDKSALTAIKQFRFKPATIRGVPVNCIGELPISFQLFKIDTFQGSKNRGLKYLKSGEYNNAIEAFNDAINFNSKFSPCYYGRGIAYMNLGKYEKAVSDFSEAIKLTPGIGTYYKLRGQAYSGLKEYQKAIDDYNKAIEKKPDMIKAYFDRGEAFRESGKYKKAIDDYTRVIKLNKNFAQAYNVRAVSYNKLNDTKDMCLDLKKACELGDCRGFNYTKKAGKCNGDLANAKLKGR